MSRTGSLEKGAHHQVLDLSEELPPPHHHHHHHAPNHHHSPALHPPPGSPAPSAGVVVVPPPYSAAEGGDGPPPELRGALDCWACSVLVTAQNLLIAAVNAGLAGLVFGLILSPAIVMVMFGFLCHSTVRSPDPPPFCSDLLSDGGCVALLVVGFLLVTPLLVLALAAYCRLARHLQLGLCFIPYSRAVFKNLPPVARGNHAAGGCCSCCWGGAGGGGGGQGGAEPNGKGKVWV